MYIKSINIYIYKYLLIYLILKPKTAIKMLQSHLKKDAEK